MHQVLLNLGHTRCNNFHEVRTESNNYVGLFIAYKNLRNHDMYAF